MVFRLTVRHLLALLIIFVIGSVSLHPRVARSEQGGLARAVLPVSEGPSAGVPPLTGVFAVRNELRPAVEFWKSVFGIYTTDQALVHHAYRLDVVYAVLDFSDLEGNPRASRIRRARVKGEIARVRAMLRKFGKLSSPATLSEKERRIYDLLKGAPGGGFAEAARPDNIHVQSGISDRFRRGLSLSRRYLPEIEAIFSKAGLPPQLTRLPFVESTFNVKAHSKAGASGIWQFIPSTGRLYMKVGRAVDERRDPILASRAATKLLRYNYSNLHSWPLAVTAYNHGLGGVQRAVRSTGSRDIVQIIKRYRGRQFGYASRNFFVELLAAIEVERSYMRYFGELVFASPFAYDEIRVSRPIFAKNLVSAGMTRGSVADLNPALSKRTLSNYYAIPAGMKLRTQIGRGEQVVAKLNALSARELPSASAGRTLRHRVRRGESLTSVSRRYGVTRHALARANGVSSRAHLRIGQRLKIPGGARRARVATTSYGAKGRRAVFLRRADPARTYEERGGWIAPPETRVAETTLDATGLVLGGGPSVPPGRDPEAAAPPPDRPPVVERAKSVPAPPPARPPVQENAARAAPTVPPEASTAAASPAPSGAAGGRKPLSSPGAVTDAPPSGVASRAAVPKKSARVSAGAPARRTRVVTHVVRRNETLWLISRKYKTTVTRIRRANAGKKLKPLLPGTRLRIPVIGTTHVVKRNETLWGIAKRYRVSLTRLRQANRGKRLSPLRPGTRLRIPG